MEDGACCDRVSLNFGSGGGEHSCKTIQLGSRRNKVNFEPCAGRSAHNTVPTTGLAASTHFFVAPPKRVCVRVLFSLPSYLLGLTVAAAAAAVFCGASPG